MSKGIFRFYEELNDFLPKHRRKTDFEAPFKGKRSIKDMIESLGVPHTEIDLILVNGKSVDLNYILRDGDRISVYPVFELLNITEATRLRKIPLRRTKFIADINLGDIVKYMRVLGFNVFFDPLLTPREIIGISNTENRIILTRSRKLLKFKEVSHGIFLRPGTIPEQIRRIIEYLDIKDNIVLFSRCLLCNTPLKSVSKEKILNKIPPRTKECCDEYVCCPSCDKIYWKGTHVKNMKKVVGQILDPREH
jgi:uncharacterized protein with PIN domain/sulfur carrier protein ThiS